MKRRKRIGAVLLSAALVFTPAQAGASESSGDTSLSERVAALESELSRLEEEVGVQTGELTDDNDTSAADGTTQNTTGDTSESGDTDPVSGASESDPQQFLEAAAASFNKRRQTAAEYSSDDLSAMSEAERVSYYYECVKSEDGFYNRYRNALFSDKNLQYYCHVYRTSIEQQEAACEQYQQDGSGEKFNDAWYIGYYNRVVAITGLYDNYNAAFDADTVEQMRADIGLDDTLREEQEANSSVDTDTVYSVQTMLNTLGYSCGEADGICGLATVRAIRHFQAMNKLSITGVIDSSLVSALTEQTGG